MGWTRSRKRCRKILYRESDGISQEAIWRYWLPKPPNLVCRPSRSWTLKLAEADASRLAGTIQVSCVQVCSQGMCDQGYPVMGGSSNLPSKTAYQGCQQWITAVSGLVLVADTRRTPTCAKQSLQQMSQLNQFNDKKNDGSYVRVSIFLTPTSRLPGRLSTKQRTTQMGNIQCFGAPMPPTAVFSRALRTGLAHHQMCLNSDIGLSHKPSLAYHRRLQGIPFSFHPFWPKESVHPQI